MASAQVIEISGTTAAEIADRVRDLVSAGRLAAGDTLPPIRQLAVALGVNRNTVAAAYRLLVAAGTAETSGRNGTTITRAPSIESEGLASTGDVVNLASGNPDPAFLPDARHALGRLHYDAPLYGTPAVDERLRDWAEADIGAAVEGEHAVTLANGAVDAVERLISAHLTRGDLVAVEDPCFLSSIGTLRINGYRTSPVPVDDEGMLADGLDRAIRSGARAVIITPRAHNPTGASLSEQRAADLRAVLEQHPHVLVIEDDHFSAIAASTYHRATPATAPRWALVRSVSKFLGPDLRLAFIAADPATAAALEVRASSGATWVSHLLQQLTGALLTDPRTEQLLDEARLAYAERASTLASALADRGIGTNPRPDGLNVWVEFDAPVDALVAELRAVGWAVRSGDAFATENGRHRNAIRVTTAALPTHRAAEFAAALATLAGRVGLRAAR